MFYGPVLSRRFGYSLGIDPVPFKVCAYDCMYCQLGRTTDKTVERKRYIDIDFKDFENELIKRIKDSPYIDYITFSGSGEPTLNSDIGKFIDIIKKISNVPMLVLTGGGTMGFNGVIEDIIKVDIIKVSMDAPDNRLLKKINRPCKGINFSKNIAGLKKLVKVFSGEVWLEIMILKDINDDLDSALKFKRIINDLGEGIKKVHLNTAVRSPHKYLNKYHVKIPALKRLKEIKDILGDKAEIVGKANYKKYSHNLVNKEEEIIELLKRRPMGAKDIAFSLGLNLNEVIKIINKLLAVGEIKHVIHNDINEKEYYFKPKEQKV